MRLHQLSPATWPNGEAHPLAVLAEEPNNLPHLIFERDSDDLGDILLSVVETFDGWRFGLLRYVDSPTQGTGVFVVAEVEQLPDALAALEAAFEITRDRLRWVSPAALSTEH